MPIASGCHHVALVTEDLDRLIEFYSGIFEAKVEWDMREGPIRHAMVNLGGMRLHPFQFPGDHPGGKASDAIFERGHLDHFAITLPDPDSYELARERLVKAEASDGRLLDWGPVIQTPFDDPDGMYCEISIIANGPIRTREKLQTHPWPTPLSSIFNSPM